MATFPTLKTERLLFRQFNDNDLENVFQGLSHPKVIPYYGVSFKTKEETQEQMTWFADLEKNNKGIWWAICSLDNQIFYGAGGLNDMDLQHKKAEIGFWLLPQHWGNGIMKEGMNVITNFAFEKLKLKRIEGFVDHRNQNCKKAMSKLDFILEGTMRDCEVKDGQFVSTDIYALINQNLTL